MSQKNNVIPLILSSLDATKIGAGTWSTFDPLTGACFWLRIINNSDTDVFISYNGSDRHEYIKAGDSIECNFQTNSSPSNKVAKVKKGTIIYVQGSPAQGGDIYLAGYYNDKF